MKYLALLRGVNVGGNAVIKMADLKKAVEKTGFTSVSTFIQSGNVIFESVETDSAKITGVLEKDLKKTFMSEIRVVLRTYEQLKKVVAEVPPDWNKRKDIRCYIAFVREPVTAQDVMREIEIREGIDFVKAGDGVVYMTTLLSALTKSKFTKIISKPIYKDMTIRNYNTVQKLVKLME